MRRFHGYPGQRHATTNWVLLSLFSAAIPDISALITLSTLLPELCFLRISSCRNNSMDDFFNDKKKRESKKRNPGGLCLHFLFEKCFLAPGPFLVSRKTSSVSSQLPVHSSHLPRGYFCLPAFGSPNSVQQFLVETVSYLAHPYVDPEKKSRHKRTLKKPFPSALENPQDDLAGEVLVKRTVCHSARWTAHEACHMVRAHSTSSDRDLSPSTAPKHLVAVGRGRPSG